MSKKKSFANNPQKKPNNLKIVKINRKPKKLSKNIYKLSSCKKGKHTMHGVPSKKKKPQTSRSLNQKYDKVRKKRVRRIVWKVIRRTFLVIFVLLLLCGYALYRVGDMVANGPSKTAKEKFVLSLIQASATKWVPGLFLSDEEVSSIIEKSKEQSVTVIKVDDYGNKNKPGDNTSGGSDWQEDDFWADAVDGTKLIMIGGASYKGYVLLVRDPANVFVGVSSDNFKAAGRGAQIFSLVDRYKSQGVVAAINGGEFPDTGGKGTGAAPIGLTYSKGQCVWDDGHRRTFIGFDSNNRLIVRNSMTNDEAQKLGIRDAVSFQNGNLLIENDGTNVKLHYADKDTGTAQRTAIGQAADGTVIMVVTDGRTASSLGATRNDIIKIMVSYKAIVAGMLDGGSSAMMYYENYWDKFGIDQSTLDDYQKKGLVNRYKAFTPPRHLPTYFLVKKG